MGWRRHFMIPEAATSPSGTIAKSATSNTPILVPLFASKIFVHMAWPFSNDLHPIYNKRVTSIERTRTGFTLHLSDGERFTAQKVIIATGPSHFEHVPSQLAALPKDLLSHSCAHVDLNRFKGRDVTVIGGGASATELATLLYEAGSNVRMVARQPSIELHTRMQSSRTLAQKIRRPISTIGPGWKSRFFSDLPLIFHHLPKPVQNRLVKGFLGPAGGWFLRGRFDQVPLLAGYQIKGAEASSDRAILWLTSGNGDARRIETEHVIAATGYRANIRRLPFLSAGITSQLNLFGDVPGLSSRFESSVPGLFFVGPAAVHSFGPVLRFACGAKFTASRLSSYWLGPLGCVSDEPRRLHPNPLIPRRHEWWTSERRGGGIEDSRHCNPENGTGRPDIDRPSRCRFRVAALTPYGHPVRRSRKIRDHFTYHARPRLRSTVCVIDRWSPDLLVCADDLGVRELQTLHQRTVASDDKSRRRISELIEFSLGPPTSFPAMHNKSDFSALVEAEGLRCPKTIVIPATRAFESVPADLIYPIVVKADQSYGGLCVRVVNSSANVRAAVWELHTASISD
jgi:Pyridine nucleotide-disulphide oxidoreductase